MNARDHLAVGLVSAGVVVGVAHAVGGNLGPYGLAIGPAVAGIGALAPDIDHPDSWIASRIPLTLASAGFMLLLAPVVFGMAAKSGGVMSGVWASFAQWNAPMLKWGALALGLGILMLVVASLVRRAVQHRGATHSLALAGTATIISLMLAIILGLGPWLGLMFGIGWFSHLMADAITPHGLPSLLWPLPAREEKGAMRSFGILLIPFVAFGMFGWYQSFQGGLFSAGEPASAASGQAGSAQPATGDVSLARQRLKDAAPDIEKALVNPDDPKVSAQGDKTTYEWQYMRQTDSGSASVKKIAITLDGSGRLVGSTQQ